MNVGFTGTRRGMTTQQAELLRMMLQLLGKGNGKSQREFHAGGSGDADLTAQEIAYRMDWWPHVHPCSEPEARDPRFVWHDVFPPLVRNRHIVEAVAVLLAAPWRDKEELRSGTWATVRYARQRGIPVVMLPRGGGRSTRTTTASTGVRPAAAS